MREQPKDRNRLQHIQGAIDTILSRCEGMTFEDFIVDKVFFYGIVYHTMIIGEAAYNLTKAFRMEHNESEWMKIAKMRHNLVHGYYQVDPEIVWSVIKDDLPPLREQVNRYLTETDWEEWEKSEVVIKETAVHKSLMESARRMKKRGYDIEEISKITGLDHDEIEAI